MSNEIEISETNTPAARVALYAALAKAQAMLRAVDKASRNEYHGYNYASAEDMMTASTAVLGECGLAFICTGSSFNKQAQTMSASYVVTHEGGGIMELGSHEITVHPDKGRPMDKAISTALTYLQAYTLRGVFNIPRVPEGTERDSTDDRAIAEYNRELGEAEKRADKAVERARKAKKDLLVTKKAKMKPLLEAFCKAAGVKPDAKNTRDLIVWTSSVDSFPSAKDLDGISDAVDETWLYLSGWENEDEIDALAEAHRFKSECFPDADKARADAAFEASQEESTNG